MNTPHPVHKAKYMDNVHYLSVPANLFSILQVRLILVGLG